ncbi:hypothetical protein [Mesobacterium pallidum]|uniref:hypothetical protein n=1 Tax=Mesobacterium pallidum TaxID=2872037 RepID=UPI001EE1575E|nr:hypothetical protein [Mesobacterium pallidum]
MKLVLHIGPPKTGTTVIQGVLFRHRKALAEAGAYVFHDPVDQARPLSTLYHQPNRPMVPPLRAHFSSKQEAMNWSQRAWARLQKQVKEQKPRIVILSSEHFSTLDEHRPFMKRLRKMFDEIEVIGYARSPDSLYCSALDQFIRAGMRLGELSSPWEYTAPTIWRFKRYLQSVGPEHMTVRRFDRALLHEGDVVADLFYVMNEKLGLDLPTTDDRGPAKVNSSLSGAAAAFLLMMNETYVRLPEGEQTRDQSQVKARQALVEKLRKAPELADLPSLKLPDDKLRQVILWKNRDKLEWFNETFFDAAGTPFDLPQDPGADPAQEEQYAFLSDWLRSYLTPDATERLARVVLAPPAVATQAEGGPQTEAEGDPQT